MIETIQEPRGADIMISLEEMETVMETRLEELEVTQLEANVETVEAVEEELEISNEEMSMKTIGRRLIGGPRRSWLWPEHG
jgi:hypothetical protein